MNPSVRRALTAALAGSLVALTSLAGAPAASAHAGLIGSDPADRAELDSAPGEVTLEFNEAIREPAYVVVTAAGERVEDGEVEVVDNTVAQTVAASAPAGDWTVAYRVVSSDGHPISGEIGFTVAEPEPEPEPAPETAPEPEPPAEPAPEPDTDASAEPDATAAPAEPEASHEGFWHRHGDHVVIGAALLALAAAVLVIARRRSA